MIFILKNWKILLGGGIVIALIAIYAITYYKAYHKGYNACQSELKDNYIKKAKQYEKIIANRPDDTALFDLLQNGKF